MGHVEKYIEILKKFQNKESHSDNHKALQAAINILENEENRLPIEYGETLLDGTVPKIDMLVKGKGISEFLNYRNRFGTIVSFYEWDKRYVNARVLIRGRSYFSGKVISCNIDDLELFIEEE